MRADDVWMTLGYLPEASSRRHPRADGPVWKAPPESRWMVPGTPVDDTFDDTLDDALDDTWMTFG